MKNSTNFKLNKLLSYTSLILLGAGIGVGSTYTLYNPGLIANAESAPSIGRDNNLAKSSSAPSKGENFVSQVVNKVGAAVVRIDASKTVTTKQPEILNDPFFREFFGSELPKNSEEQIQRGVGSGFVVSSDGLILTNAHVVEGADQVSVTLKDGRSLSGRVIGTDPVTDVAVVKIEATNLPTATFANSDQLEIGEWAIAIGNPLGLDNTVTTGIVSATDRSSSQVGVPAERVNFIQTDAAINPGNSGGPLLNADGEVIGINTAIIQNAQGIGFAIPINKARNIAEELIAKGKVDHAYLGIRMVAITPEIKEQVKNRTGLELQDKEGILIIGVEPNSPADQAGLKGGDVIKMVNGEPLKDPAKLQEAVENADVGDVLALNLDREKNNLDVSVKVGALPKTAEN